ncbi:MAG: hypothetical protein ACR2KK_05785 [Acidimicrobiales bacterium]
MVEAMYLVERNLGAAAEVVEIGAIALLQVSGQWSGADKCPAGSVEGSQDGGDTGGGGWRAHAGNDGDMPVPGNYDANRTTDKAMYRPSTGQWFVLLSPGGTPAVSPYGAAGDVPQPPDYDGNGATDRAVYRPTTGAWFVSGGSPEVAPFGAAGDVPVVWPYVISSAFPAPGPGPFAPG